MGGLAKGKMKKTIEDYEIAVEHYVLTGEEVNQENFKEIKKYSKNFKKFQKKFKKISKNFKKNSKNFKKIQKIFKNFQKTFEIIKKFQGHSRTFN